MANKDFFDGLGEEDQKLIEKASSEAYDYIVDYQKGLADSELKKITDAKPEMTVTVLNEEQRECFKEAAADVEATFIEMTGESGQKILDQMKADLKAAEEG